jgi:hypothetical protein
LAWITRNGEATLNDTNHAGDDLRVDLLIDKITAIRGAGGTARAPGDAGLSPDEALVYELSELGEIDVPADAVGERIAMNVMAAADGRAVPVPESAQPIWQPGGQRAATRRLPSGRARWLAASTAAAVAVAVALAGTFLIGGAHNATRHLSGRTPPKSSATHPALRQPSLTAMTMVGSAKALQAVGGVSNGSNFLTCVTRSVCYILPQGNKAGMARTTNGGATWSAGKPLPWPDIKPCKPKGSSHSCSMPNVWTFNMDLSCPHALRCFQPFGPNLLETSDGFAHSRLQPVNVLKGTGNFLEWVSCPTAQRCVAATTATTFIYSDDGGRSWAVAGAPAVSPGYTITGLRCDPGGACIAAVVGGSESAATVAALSSTDGGRSWTMSAAYPVPSAQQEWMTSCGDGRNCLVGFNDRALAWIHATPGGAISIHVQAFPTSWPALNQGETISCTTGRICFFETAEQDTFSYTKVTIEETRNGGRTWSSLGTPMDPADPGIVAAYLSCPVAAGCIGVANTDPFPTNPAANPKWVVLSNLNHSG